MFKISDNLHFSFLKLYQFQMYLFFCKLNNFFNFGNSLMATECMLNTHTHIKRKDGSDKNI